MQMKTKKEVLEENLKEWLACKKDRKKRGEMTKNISSILHIHKKSVGRAFTTVQLTSKSDTEHRGRAVYYGPDVTNALCKTSADSFFLNSDVANGKGG